MQINSKPEELDELDRRIMQLKIEREALRKENDKASKDRLEALEHELADLEEKSASVTARWQEEKKSVQDVQSHQGKARCGAPGTRRRTAPRRSRPRRRTHLWRDPRSREEAEGHRGPVRQRARHGSGDARSTSRASSRAGPAFPSTRCSKASARSFCTWKRRWRSASSASTKPCARSRTPCAAAAQACRIPTVPSARSCSWAPRASARRSSPRRWPNSCSTTTPPWCASTCRSSWRSTRSRA